MIREQRLIDTGPESEAPECRTLLEPVDQQQPSSGTEHQNGNNQLSIDNPAFNVSVEIQNPNSYSQQPSSPPNDQN